MSVTHRGPEYESLLRCMGDASEASKKIWQMYSSVPRVPSNQSKMPVYSQQLIILKGLAKPRCYDTSRV
jgi:hypothetical protein